MEFKKNPIEDSFEIGEEIGSGQFAVVRHARHRESGEEAAAKYIRRKRTAASRRGVCDEVIAREVRVLQDCRHENIVRLLEVYETGNYVILVMELVSGGELFEYLAEKERVSEDEAVVFVKQILDGIQYMHRQRMVHLDLKPENLMLLNHNSKRLKIIDFGLSRYLHADSECRELLGTPEFVAPEVINFDPLCLATDMWSIGVITYILLSGCSPFLGDDKQETLANISAMRYDFDNENFATTSELAKDFIRKLLVYDPRKRASVEEALAHSWINPIDSSQARYRRSSSINLDNLKTFVARSKWKQYLAVIRACNHLIKSHGERQRLRLREQRMSSRSSCPDGWSSPIDSDSQEFAKSVDSSGCPDSPLVSPHKQDGFTTDSLESSRVSDEVFAELVAASAPHPTVPAESTMSSVEAPEEAEPSQTSENESDRNAEENIGAPDDGDLKEEAVSEVETTVNDNGKKHEKKVSKPPDKPTRRSVRASADSERQRPNSGGSKTPLSTQSSRTRARHSAGPISPEWHVTPAATRTKKGACSPSGRGAAAQGSTRASAESVTNRTRTRPFSAATHTDTEPAKARIRSRQSASETNTSARGTRLRNSACVDDSTSKTQGRVANRSAQKLKSQSNHSPPPQTQRRRQSGSPNQTLNPVRRSNSKSSNSSDSKTRQSSVSKPEPSSRTQAKPYPDTHNKNTILSNSQSIDTSQQHSTALNTTTETQSEHTARGGDINANTTTQIGYSISTDTTTPAENKPRDPIAKTRARLKNLLRYDSDDDGFFVRRSTSNRMLTDLAKGTDSAGEESDSYEPSAGPTLSEIDNSQSETGSTARQADADEFSSMKHTSWGTRTLQNDSEPKEIEEEAAGNLEENCEEEDQHHTRHNTMKGKERDSSADADSVFTIDVPREKEEASSEGGNITSGIEDESGDVSDNGGDSDDSLDEKMDPSDNDHDEQTISSTQNATETQPNHPTETVNEARQPAAGRSAAQFRSSPKEIAGSKEITKDETRPSSYGRSQQQTDTTTKRKQENTWQSTRQHSTGRVDQTTGGSLRERDVKVRQSVLEIRRSSVDSHQEDRSPRPRSGVFDKAVGVATRIKQFKVIEESGDTNPPAAKGRSDAATVGHSAKHTSETIVSGNQATPNDEKASNKHATSVSHVSPTAEPVGNRARDQGAAVVETGQERPINTQNEPEVKDVSGVIASTAIDSSPAKNVAPKVLPKPQSKAKTMPPDASSRLLENYAQETKDADEFSSMKHTSWGTRILQNDSEPEEIEEEAAGNLEENCEEEDQHHTRHNTMKGKERDSSADADSVFTIDAPREKEEASSEGGNITSGIEDESGDVSDNGGDSDDSLDEKRDPSDNDHDERTISSTQNATETQPNHPTETVNEARQPAAGRSAAQFRSSPKEIAGSKEITKDETRPSSYGRSQQQTDTTTKRKQENTWQSTRQHSTGRDDQTTRCSQRERDVMVRQSVLEIRRSSVDSHQEDRSPRPRSGVFNKAVGVATRIKQFKVIEESGDTNPPAAKGKSDAATVGHSAKHTSETIVSGNQATPNDEKASNKHATSVSHVSPTAEPVGNRARDQGAAVVETGQERPINTQNEPEVKDVSGVIASTAIDSSPAKNVAPKVLPKPQSKAKTMPPDASSRLLENYAHETKEPPAKAKTMPPATSSKLPENMSQETTKPIAPKSISIQPKQLSVKEKKNLLFSASHASPPVKQEPKLNPRAKNKVSVKEIKSALLSNQNSPAATAAKGRTEAHHPVQVTSPRKASLPGNADTRGPAVSERRGSAPSNQKRDFQQVRATFMHSSTEQLATPGAGSGHTPPRSKLVQSVSVSQVAKQFSSAAGHSKQHSDDSGHYKQHSGDSGHYRQSSGDSGHYKQSSGDSGHFKQHSGDSGQSTQQPIPSGHYKQRSLDSGQHSSDAGVVQAASMHYKQRSVDSSGSASQPESKTSSRRGSTSTTDTEQSDPERPVRFTTRLELSRVVASEPPREVAAPTTARQLSHKAEIQLEIGGAAGAKPVLQLWLGGPPPTQQHNGGRSHSVDEDVSAPTRKAHRFQKGLSDTPSGTAQLPAQSRQRSEPYFASTSSKAERSPLVRQSSDQQSQAAESEAEFQCARARVMPQRSAQRSRLVSHEVSHDASLVIEAPPIGVVVPGNQPSTANLGPTAFGADTNTKRTVTTHTEFSLAPTPNTSSVAVDDTVAPDARVQEAVTVLTGALSRIVIPGPKHSPGPHSAHPSPSPHTPHSATTPMSANRPQSSNSASAKQPKSGGAKFLFNNL